MMLRSSHFIFLSEPKYQMNAINQKIYFKTVNLYHKIENINNHYVFLAIIY